PQEGGEELVRRTVSFTKGCYTGQELVASIDARGSNVPRRLQILHIEGEPSSPDAPAPGDEVHAGGAAVGELTSVAWSKARSSYVALAYVKRSALATRARAGTRGGSAISALVGRQGTSHTAEIRPLPDGSKVAPSEAETRDLRAGREAGERG
ncbi:MAG: glycine cleavage T C-terminal barrel domain-containing protein, partial [Acidimicrobiales bacterium]